MDLRFQTVELQALCNRRGAMAARWGPDVAAAVGQRLQELEAVDTLGDLDLFPHLRLVPVEAGRAVAVDDADGNRILLSVEPPGHRSDGTVLWRQSRAAVIVEVVVADSHQ